MRETVIDTTLRWRAEFARGVWVALWGGLSDGSRREAVAVAQRQIPPRKLSVGFLAHSTATWRPKFGLAIRTSTATSKTRPRKTLMRSPCGDGFCRCSPRRTP